MVDYIRDDEEQAELLKNWWQKNGTAVIITIVLAIAAMVGLREWRSYQGEEAASASSQYQSMMSALNAHDADQGNAVDVQAAADGLIESYPDSSYADFARLVQARLAVEAEDYDAARSLLAAVAEEGANEAIRYTAKIRLVRVLLQLGALDDAEQALAGEHPQAWQGVVLELKGDLAKARNNPESARDAYAAALDALEGGAEKDRVQMKLDDLKSAS